jgi:hypothetical protein
MPIRQCLQLMLRPAGCSTVADAAGRAGAVAGVRAPPVAARRRLSRDIDDDCRQRRWRGADGRLAADDDRDRR